MATDKKNQAIYCSDEEKAIAKAAIAEYRAEQLKHKAELAAVPKGPIAPEMFFKAYKEVCGATCCFDKAGGIFGAVDYYNRTAREFLRV